MLTTTANFINSIRLICLCMLIYVYFSMRSMPEPPNSSNNGREGWMRGVTFFNGQKIRMQFHGEMLPRTQNLNTLLPLSRQLNSFDASAVCVAPLQFKIELYVLHVSDIMQHDVFAQIFVPLQTTQSVGSIVETFSRLTIHSIMK